MDIVSLYTNIPNHEALIPIADHLRADPEMYHIGPYILRLSEVCLHNTNFILNREHFMQLGGTPKRSIWDLGTKTVHPYGINLAL
jgi:hypothetical protein